MHARRAAHPSRSHSLTITLSLPPSLPHSLTLTLSLSHTHSLSHTRTPRTWASSCRARTRRIRSEREFFIDNLLVRIHFIIVMIWWTGLAPGEFEFPFPGSLISHWIRSCDRLRVVWLNGRGTTRAEDAQGKPTQSHISPSILVYENTTPPSTGTFQSRFV